MFAFKSLSTIDNSILINESSVALKLTAALECMAACSAVLLQQSTVSLAWAAATVRRWPCDPCVIV